ncbi:MAG: hypothetical protein ACO3V5_09425, partial [Ilumatobacteraceae bacterium]
QYYAATPMVAVTDVGGSGSGAIATATIVNGVVTGITIVSGGSGYVRPRITIAPPAVATGLSMSLVPVPLATIIDDTGVGATATVLTDDSGLITGVAVGNHQATANVVASNGVITGIDITFGGATYTSLQPPMVTISDASGTGSGALATVTVSADGVVTGITVTAGGSGYVNPVVSIGPPATLNSGYTNPTVVFSVPGMPDFVVPADATAIVTNGVFAAQVTNPGVLYQSAPIVTISDSAGSGGGAVATAVMEGGRIIDLVFTSYGSGYLSPVVTIAPPTVDISAAPQGPSRVNHTFFFLDGSSWSTTTTSASGISLQYQLIDQLTALADSAAAGLSDGNGNTTADAYTLQAYLAPLLSKDSPTFALAENLAIVMPTASNAPLVWYVSAQSNDALVGQALFPQSSWTIANVGEVSLGNIELAMNVVGTNAGPGFIGSAQVGYVDLDLVASQVAQRNFPS